MTNATTKATTAVAASLLLVLAGCGSSPTSDSSDGGQAAAQAPTDAEKFFKQMSAKPDDARRDALVKQAQEEGEFDLYTSMTADVADEVTGAFSDEFDVDVNVYRASSETVLQRILQEQQAGYRGNDVVESNATEMFALEQENDLTTTYRSDRRDLVSQDGRYAGWTATRYNLFDPSWNTKEVSAAEAPTSWEDLADPKWDGELSMEVGDYDWYLTLYRYWEKQGKSTEEIDKLFADMADGAKIVKGHTVQGELMSAGQFSLTASNYTYLVETLKRTGAPVEYKPYVEPVIARPNGIGLMKTAKHPAAAMLFTDWLLGAEGQKILVSLGLTPSVAPGGADPLAGTDVIPVDVKELLANGDEWSDRYDKVVEGGEVVDE